MQLSLWLLAYGYLDNASESEPHSTSYLQLMTKYLFKCKYNRYNLLIEPKQNFENPGPQCHAVHLYLYNANGLVFVWQLLLNRQVVPVHLPFLVCLTRTILWSRIVGETITTEGINARHWVGKWAIDSRFHKAPRKDYATDATVQIAFRFASK